VTVQASFAIGRPNQKIRSPWAITWCAFSRNSIAMIGLAVLAAVCLSTVAAPWLAPYDPLHTDYKHLSEAPTASHWFGTDDLGRDIFSRVLWGGGETLSVGMLAVLIGLACGTLFGLISGYAGGLTDEIIQRIVDITLAFPSILLMLSIVTIVGRGLQAIILAVGIAYVPVTTRFVRGNVLAIKNLAYVEAARSIGARHGWILMRHIFPNTSGPLIVFFSLLLGGSVLVTAGLNYIGLGARPPSPEWGAMLNYGRNFLTTAWWMSVFPGLAVFIVALCINMVGDGLRQALDPEARV
jgi:ABC-type dipeptide/oligopeptide/nickel transport system permease subunit